MSQDLELTQRQKFRLTQQQINVGRLLELNAPEFDELVERELDTNPALEAVEGTLDAPAERLPEGESGPDVSSDSAYWYGAAPQRSSRGSGSEAPSFTPADNSESLYDFLNAQINERPLSPEIAAMAHYIVGNLDSNGYLRRPLDRMLDDLAVNTGHDVPREIAKMAYDVVRELDPPASARRICATACCCRSGDCPIRRPARMRRRSLRISSTRIPVATALKS